MRILPFPSVAKALGGAPTQDLLLKHFGVPGGGDVEQPMAEPLLIVRTSGYWAPRLGSPFEAEEPQTAVLPQTAVELASPLDPQTAVLPHTAV